ncbi:electron transfer flavoprotein-ubiquinone oxidoreductase [Candidatus Spongiihabitans sp.]|uniref:electron transfer flavoprotein-ubiquinone oxidoreductase n=1 Tax=Candidatus Spongiihabitans sp. TaxID=3101308 RepID=UPI003C7CBD82
MPEQEPKQQPDRQPDQQPERESMEVDVVIVGAGPAGLSAACKLMQLAEAQQKELSVVVLEKGSEVGAHILSGALFEPRALNELFPDWKERGAPLETPVQKDQVLMFQSESKALSMPLWMVPKPMHNAGNYIISLGDLCRWLGEQAEGLGVEIFPGFPASEVLFHEDGGIKGVATGEMGRGADGARKPSFEPGMELHARVTIFAEGCRGHLGKQLIEKFALDATSQTQHYGIGIKELWRIKSDQHMPGLVVHGAGWPLSEHGAAGGSFLYHLGDDLVSLGLITDLSYDNPYLSPFDELQRLKHHPLFKQYLEGGERIAYGARAITKGGLNALPKMTLPNALLIGCDAGTLNFSKIKGSHTAMKSGLLAAETAFDVIHGNGDVEDYQRNFENSWLYEELHQSRNFGAALHKFGTWMGGAYNFIDQNIFNGKLPFKLTDPVPDHETLKPASEFEPIAYAKPDGALSFDTTSSVYLSNTNHEEDQPTHLQLAQPGTAVEVNFNAYAGPEARFCPAGVYEFVHTDDKPALQINAQNCVHCKTCDIKDPTMNITWVSPEGGGGPNYASM